MKSPRNVLGRGLGALIPAPKPEPQKPAAAPQEAGPPREFFRCPIELIKPSGEQPRKQLDPARLQELAESIKNQGLIQPLVLRKEGDHYVLIAGERRWRAAQAAGLHEVPAIVRETSRREAFYWLAILFTFALGTAAGDLVAEKADLGYGISIAIFGGAIALVAIAHYGLKMGPVLSFWLAYILTRPLGASIGDFLSQNRHKYGGLGLGATGTSYIFVACIFALVAYLTISKRDQTPPELAAAEAGAI